MQFIKINQDNSQIANPEKKPQPTVMLTCSLHAKKKLGFFPLFPGSSPAL